MTFSYTYGVKKENTIKGTLPKIIEQLQEIAPLKAKGVQLLQKIGVLPQVIQEYLNGTINKSERQSLGAILYWCDDENTPKYTKRLEYLQEKGLEVVHVVDSVMTDGYEKIRMINYLVVSNEDLEEDRKFLEPIEGYGYRAFAYVDNQTFGIKEFGYMGIKPMTGGIARTF